MVKTKAPEYQNLLFYFIVGDSFQKSLDSFL